MVAHLIANIYTRISIGGNFRRKFKVHKQLSDYTLHRYNSFTILTLKILKYKRKKKRKKERERKKSNQYIKVLA